MSSHKEAVFQADGYVASQQHLHPMNQHWTTNLKSKFVLILIGKTPHFSNNIAEIVLHKQYGRTEFCSHSFFIMIWCFIAVITVKKILKSSSHCACIITIPIFTEYTQHPLHA